MGKVKSRIKGGGTLFKRNGKYVYQWTDVTGKKKTRTLKRSDNSYITELPEAQASVAELRTELRRIEQIESKLEYAAQVAEAKKLICRTHIAIPEIWQKYVESPFRPDSGEATLKFYKQACKIFTAWLTANYPAAKTIDKVDENIARDFATCYWNTGISERTYNARISSLALLFKVLMRDENPFAAIKHKTERQQSRNAFTLDQLHAISRTIDSPDYYMLNKEEMRLLILIMLYTGCRGEDACLMQWKSVNLSSRTINYTPLKTARKRPQGVIVPIAAPLQLALESHPKGCNAAFVIPAVAERYRRNPCGISQDISKLLERSGIPTKEAPDGIRRKRAIVRFSMHSFRHTFCTLAINGGIPITAIQSIVGHSTTAMTSHYSHVSLGTKQTAVNILPDISSSISNRSDSISAEDRIRRAIDFLNNCQLTPELSQLSAILKD